MLGLRLQQVYDQCASLGVQPDLVYALVVVDASLMEHPPLERNAARVALATETKKLFAAGETIAIHGDRGAGVPARPELADRVAILGAALHTHACCATIPSRPGWSASQRTPPTCAAASTT